MYNSPLLCNYSTIPPFPFLWGFTHPILAFWWAGGLSLQVFFIAPLQQLSFNQMSEQMKWFHAQIFHRLCLLVLWNSSVPSMFMPTQACQLITQIFRIIHAKNVTLRRRKSHQIHDFSHLNTKEHGFSSVSIQPRNKLDIEIFASSP